MADNDTNGKVERGRFEGKVLEALDHLKDEVIEIKATNKAARQRLYDKIQEVHELSDGKLDKLSRELANQKSNNRVTALKVSGMIVFAGLVLQGIALWWTN